MKCSGRNAVSGEPIEAEFDSTIKYVDPMLGWSRDDGVSLAPGFIDLQVNGFAGVDFNSPLASHEEIQRAIGVIFSTGVKRFLPTVITGSHDTLLAALGIHVAALDSLPNCHALD